MKKKPYIPPRIECLTDHLVFLDYCRSGGSAASECNFGYAPFGSAGGNCSDGISARACAWGDAG